jgi:hypothetical protein
MQRTAIQSIVVLFLSVLCLPLGLSGRVCVHLALCCSHSLFLLFSLSLSLFSSLLFSSLAECCLGENSLNPIPEPRGGQQIDSPELYVVAVRAPLTM